MQPARLAARSQLAASSTDEGGWRTAGSRQGADGGRERSGPLLLSVRALLRVKTDATAES
jgi:hypothetical protein